MPANVFLCGLSGTGKSTVAPLLARLLGCEVLDTDALVIEEAGVRIAQIFQHEGEAGFREREARAVLRACLPHGAVIALGGGALERDDSYAAVRAAGVLVFMDAPDDVLRERLGKVTSEVRPMLSAPDAFARLRATRRARFEQSELSIDTAYLSPQEVAEHIEVLLTTADEVDEIAAHRR